MLQSCLIKLYNRNKEDGTYVDMNDESSINDSGLDIDVLFDLPSLLDFTFKPDTIGWWSFEVYPSGNITDSTRVTSEISASCTFNFLGDFDYLDLNTTHPSLQAIPGQPITSKCT